MSNNNESVASSAAVATPEPPTLQETVDQLTEVERTKWRETGELPEVKKPETPKAEESAPPAEVTTEVKSEEAAPARSNAETRKAELGREIQERLERRAALDREIREREERLTARPVKAVEKVEEEPEPKPEDFKGENAYDLYLDAKVKYTANKVARELVAKERAEKEKQDRERAEKARHEQDKSAWLKNVEAAEKAHPDFRQVALDPKVIAKIPSGSTLDLYVAQSAHGREVLYQLAKNQAKLAELVAIQNPLDQAFALRDFEREVLAQQAPPKKVSEAPTPPAEVGGSGAKPDDVVDAALAAGDVSAYMREMNKRELAKTKGA